MSGWVFWRALLCVSWRAQEAEAAHVQADAVRRGLAEIAIIAPANAAEARALGYPCLSAWGAMLARVIAGASVPVVVGSASRRCLAIHCPPKGES